MWPEFALIWESGEELDWTTTFQESPERRAELEDVPAGALRLVYRAEGTSAEDWHGWPAAAEFELRAGERRIVQLSE